MPAITEADKEFIRQNCHFMTDTQIAEALTRINGKLVRWHSCRDVRHKIGLKKESNGKAGRLLDGPPKPKAHRRVYARQEAYRAECLFWLVLGVIVLADVVFFHCTGRRAIASA